MGSTNPGNGEHGLAGGRYGPRLQSARRAAEAHLAIRLKLRSSFATASQAALILLVGTAAAGIWHTGAGEGFFRNGQAVANVNKSYFSRALPELSFQDVEKVVVDTNAIVIDARPPNAFEQGHLPGAMNVPVNSSPGEIREALAGVPRDARILTYCQSKGCHWDEEVASELVWSGYTNVALYTGGWAEWQAKQKEREAK